MFKKLILALLFLPFIFILFRVFSVSALAVTTTITDYPSTINSNEPFNLSVTVVGADSGTNYLRADLYKEGTTKYFGETYNNSNWYSGSEGNQFFPITISSNEGSSATFQARFGNPSSNEYDNPGDYKLRVRRYTSSGFNPTEANLSTVSVSITVPTSTPSPSPTPSPTQTTSPSPSASPSISPSPSVLPTPVKTTKPTNSPISVTSFSSPESYQTTFPSPGVLGAVSSGQDPSPTPSNSPTDTKLPWRALFFIATGLIFIGVSLFLFFKKYSKEYNGGTP